MFRLMKLASYALLGYALYELVQGVLEDHEQQGESQGQGQRRPPQRRPLRAGEPGRGVLSPRA